MSDTPVEAAGTADATRCGFVAVIGAPNAGKSTLVNALVGTKVSIVTPKAQTTRTLVRGIAMFGRAQVVFIDTPGIFRPKHRLERAMVSAAWQGAGDAELTLMVLDAHRGLDGDSQAIIDQLKKAERKVMLALNKTDAVEKPKLLELAAALNATGIFTDIFMISAKTGDGLETLKNELASRVPTGPWLFPEDDVSDMPGRLLAAEVTREKIFLNLRQELPYGCAVVTEGWDERKDGSVRIDQTILISRENHRPIVLGEKGQKLKKIGASARVELESLLGCRVHLFLHVKVDENWRNNRGLFSTWGLDFNA
ncbi:MAG: GTPase Era [Rhodobacteraceae bacterium]|nr:GTPase Era [Paracoccaceae bacterium]